MVFQKVFELILICMNHNLLQCTQHLTVGIIWHWKRNNSLVLFALNQR